MPFFSLIIPVYNVEPYLAECLDSCINQTFADLEIICVNDCSTDKSGQILEEYAKRDKRLKTINHNNNKGLGAARNTGVSIAQGNYCWFIDSDDYILLNACEILNDSIKKSKADIVRFNRIDYDYDIATGEKRLLVQKPYSWKPNVIYSKNDYTKLDIPEVSACMFIVSRIKIKNMRFREGVVHEDDDFTPILFSKVESIYYVNYSLYCVRQRMGSITKNINGITEKRLTDILLSINALYDYITAEKLPKKHFCTKTAVGLFNHLQNEYKGHPNLHNQKLDNAINETKILLKPLLIYTFWNTIVYKISRKLFRSINKDAL